MSASSLHRRAARLSTRRYTRQRICAVHRPAPRRRCASRRRPERRPRAGMGRPSRRPPLRRRPRPGSCQGLDMSRPSWASRGSSEERLPQTGRLGLMRHTLQLRVSQRGQVGAPYPCSHTEDPTIKIPLRLVQCSQTMAEGLRLPRDLGMVMPCRWKTQCSWREKRWTDTAERWEDSSEGRSCQSAFPAHKDLSHTWSSLARAGRAWSSLAKTGCVTTCCSAGAGEQQQAPGTCAQTGASASR